MALDRVTITGADDSVSAADLLPLQREFPFVEWGILVSKANTIDHNGTPRFPSCKWIADLQQLAEQAQFPNLSLHVCGQWVRQLLVGNLEIPPDFLHLFGRVQLNFHAERTKCDPAAFARRLNDIGKEFIFQVDGAAGNDHMQAAEAEQAKNCFALFDVSGGAGIVPKSWPQPIYLDVDPGEHGEGVEYWAYHGYAGGLGPHNLEHELPKILAAAASTGHTREGRIWIDMETWVRSQNDRVFDLDKVRECLSIAGKYIQK
jgi:hypothetical protein